MLLWAEPKYKHWNRVIEVGSYVVGFCWDVGLFQGKKFDGIGDNGVGLMAMGAIVFSPSHFV